MLDNMRFWLDRGVDGFRVDAVLFCMKDPAERDNPPNTDGLQQIHKPLGAYGAQLHLHDQGHPDIHEVFREMRAVLEEYEPRRMALAELHVFDPPRLAAYYGENLDELSMPTNFGLLKAPWSAAGIRGVVDGLEAAIPRGAALNWVMGTHDDQRLATRLGEQRSRQAAVLLLTLRGSPTLYYGDELGMREAEISPERQQDPWGIAEPGLGRDGCRTPMQWSADPAAGFTSAPEPWLPVGSDYIERNVESQLADPDSHLDLYRRLLRVRRGSAALRTGSYRPVDPAPPDCYAFERSEGAERVFVAINFSSEPLSIEAEGIAGRIAVSTHRASARSEATTFRGVGSQTDPREILVRDHRHGALLRRDQGRVAIRGVQGLVRRRVPGELVSQGSGECIAGAHCVTRRRIDLDGGSGSRSAWRGDRGPVSSPGHAHDLHPHFLEKPRGERGSVEQGGYSSHFRLVHSHDVGSAKRHIEDAWIDEWRTEVHIEDDQRVAPRV
jgi:hypothetical protein